MLVFAPLALGLAVPFTSEVEISGVQRTWHRVTLTIRGPKTSESASPNPFVDFRLDVTFRHKASGRIYVVPGFFAADGDAAQSGADRGDRWRVHFAPDAPGAWSYEVRFRAGRFMAVRSAEGKAVRPADGASGTFTIEPGREKAPDFRARGRLQYVGRHHLRFAGDRTFFFKVGVDAPENLLAYADFDGGFKKDGHGDQFVKTWKPHVRDWREGDPTWEGGRGRGLIGALNYLADQGLNSVSFLTMNVGGDDKNVFPYTSYDERRRFDCSRLAQWEIVFAHAQSLGLHLHFKTTEAENQGLLDGGGVGIERILYYRELIARFGHHLALNWNVGEENGEWFGPDAPTPPMTTEQRRATIALIKNLDPYDHPIVIHNGRPFDDLLGEHSALTGVSVQTHRADFSLVHGAVRRWIRRSKEAARPWVVACDEPGDPQHALVPDADNPDHDNARRNALWGVLMAGGAGIEWYFGYVHADSDLTCQDFRGRARMWAQCRVLQRFLREQKIPFWNLAPSTKPDAEDARILAGGGDDGAPFVVVQFLGRRFVDVVVPKGAKTYLWLDPKTGEGLDGESRPLAGVGRQRFEAPRPGDQVLLIR